MSLTERENWIFAQVVSGNVPNFLRTLVPITVNASIAGTNHAGTYYVIPEYVAIGTDADYFLEPVTPLLGQRLCIALGYTLPTRKMVNQIWTNAAVKLTPQPIPPSGEMTTVPVFSDHNDMVRTQRSSFTNAHPLGALVSGDKKDVIISTKIYTNFANAGITKPVVIYGWHDSNGDPIQPLYNGHEETYADYSHGIRLIQMAMTVDGSPNMVTNVLTNPNLAPLLSDEGASEGTTGGLILKPRYTVSAVAPVIITQPRNQSVLPGASAVFRALATGESPLVYRWQLNGTNLPGTTGSILAISNAQPANAGNYAVVITNSSGSATSRTAWLRINTNVHPILFADSFETDTSANWVLFWGASNGIPDYTAEWAFDHGATPYTFTNATGLIPAAPNSPEGSTKGVRFSVNNNDTNASIAAVNIYPQSQSFSNNFVLKFNLWINYPGPAGGSFGSTEHAIFGINHLGAQVNWAAPSASSSDGVWFGVDGEGGDSRDYRAYAGNLAGTQTELNGPTASGLTASNSTAAIYQTLFPGSRFETAGAPGKNWVEAELRQTNNVVVWLLDGAVVGQRTNTSGFTSGDIMLGYMDPFSSIASAPEDAFVLFDNVRVEDLGAAVLQPPAITSQPQSQSVSAGTNALFTVIASGANPLAYQWRFQGTNLATATGSSLSLSNVQPADAGLYDVVVSNAAGLAASAMATLSVEAPAIQFVSVAMLADGGLQLLFSGVPGQDYLIEASTNLASWTPIWVLTGSNRPLPFVDPAATNFSRRFYRARAGIAQTLADFEGFSTGANVLFQKPSFSGSTSNFLNTSPNFTYVTNAFPAGHAGAKVLYAAWDFKTGTTNPWLRLTSNSSSNLPNPTISTNQALQFDIYADRDLYVALGFRETSTTAAIGADGGTAGAIEWLGGTTDNTTSPPKGRLVYAGQWTTLNFFLPYEPVRSFTGNGVLESSTGKGVLEHLALVPAAGTGTYNLFLDNFRVIELAH